ncbi:MAG: hypothetical protein ACE5LC_07935 [Candidatus Aminicenantales bacterium]
MPAPATTQPSAEEASSETESITQDEQIKGIVSGMMYGSGPAWSKKRAKTYQLFFTSRRVIASKTGGTFLKNLGLLGGIPAIGLVEAIGDKKKAEELSKLSPKEILEADEANFDIPYLEISRVEVKKPGMFNPVGSIIVHTPTKKYQFNNQSDPREFFDRYIELIKTVMPDKYAGK